MVVNTEFWKAGMRISLQPISDDPEAPAGDIPYFGCVDGFDDAGGISGWVVNAAAPHLAVALELLVDGIAIPGAAIARLPRDDLAVFFPAQFETAGFRLNLGRWDRFCALTSLRPQADFIVKIAGTNFMLPRTAALPGLARIVAAAVKPERNPLDLFSRLSQLAQLAAKLPAEPAENARKGLIEAICLDDIDSRLCWFLGWTTEVQLYNEPATVLDGQKLPGAFAVATYPRDDVPAGGVGFAGVLLSDWRPHAGSELAICFGPGGQSHLRGVAGLNRITKTAFAAHIKAVAGEAAGGDLSAHWTALVALLHGPQSWLPEPAARADLQVSVDRLLVLPGFGCFATGWALSALQAVRGFALKIGRTVLSMEETSLYFRPRPDLMTLFPDSAHLLNHAGFCCFFPADEALDLTGQVLLKVTLEQGAAVHQVEPRHQCRLGHSAPLDALLQFYPAIETEPFFPGLAKFIRDESRAAGPGLTMFKITPARSAMIVALSEDRHDCLLALAEIRYYAGTHLPPDCAVTIIAGASQPHGEIIQMLEGLPACNLVFTQNPEAALRVLPELLLLLKAEQFIFVPSRHYLSESGWRDAAASVAPGHDRLTFFGIYDPETLEELNASGACFAWSWPGFARWSLNMPIRLNSMPKRQDFPAEPSPIVAARGAFISKSVRLSRLDSLLETAINA